MRHRWEISPRQAMALQAHLAASVRVCRLTGPVRRVAGADCAVLDDSTIVAAAVLCDARTMEVVASAGAVRRCRFPYVPGLLSFREAPAVIAAVRKLPVRPDLLMCDGQGVAHPRRMGLAAHVGLWVDAPTVGVAKSRLCGRHGAVGSGRGSRARLLDRGEVIGTVVRTRDAVKPLYVSVGHRVNLDQAVGWVLRCTRGFRQPEPTRQAHILVGSMVASLRRGSRLPARGGRHRIGRAGRAGAARCPAARRQVSLTAREAEKACE